MLDPTVQSAFVIILAWLLKIIAHKVNFPIDDVTVNTLAGVIVVWILSHLFPPAVRGVIYRTKTLLSKK